VRPSERMRPERTSPSGGLPVHSRRSRFGKWLSRSFIERSSGFGCSRADGSEEHYLHVPLQSEQPGGNSAGVVGGKGILNSPMRRRSGPAGRTFVYWALALAIALTFVPNSNDAFAVENTASTVRIRSGEEGAVRPAAGIDEVSQRDVTLHSQMELNSEAIVGFAMSYVGYSYYPGGTTPAGFDCSGFTYFVMLNALGINIGPALSNQPWMGAWVDYGNWLPGDLIFFQNTYQEGLSHVGIYIGDGLIVHAENEGTGVTVSSIYSDYYGPRYWGSVRVG